MSESLALLSSLQSGTHFNRAGIDKIYEVVEAGRIEAIVVKDLSRLGRHRTQTALFIDYLRERGVRSLSQKGWTPPQMRTSWSSVSAA